MIKEMKRESVVFKIDLDRWNLRKAERMVKFRLRWIDYYFNLFPCRVSFYRTHKGYHVYVACLRYIEMKPERIIIIQSCLCSDWLREIRNLNRIKDGMTKNWNLAFTAKFKVNARGELQYVSKERFMKSIILE